MRRLIAVASGKGGVGKTWLAVTLAHALARRGLRTLLVDGDVGLANVDIQLGLAKGPDLEMSLVSGRPLASAIRPVAEAGFDVLPGRSGSSRLAGLDPSLVDRLSAGLEALQGRYEVVIVDLPSGIDHGVRRWLTKADDRVVVTTDEPTTLTDAYALIKASRRHCEGEAPKILVNLAESREAGERTFDGLARVCDRFLGITPRLLGVARRDRRVADAIGRQTPLLRCYPNCAAASDVIAAAERLVTMVGS